MTRIYKVIGDSVISGFTGYGFLKEHLRMDLSITAFRGKLEGSHGADDDTNVLLTEPVSARLAYNLCPDKKYEAFLFYLFLNEDHSIHSGLKLLSYLKAQESLSMVTDKQIENLAWSKLHLVRGAFDYEFDFDVFGEEGLTLRINEPDRWRHITSHSSKVRYGKCIIVNPFTGRVIEQRRAKREYYEADY